MRTLAADRRTRRRQHASRSAVVLAAGGLAVALLFAGRLAHHSVPAAQNLGPEGVAVEAGPPLAFPDTTAIGQSVDGIGCLDGEQTAYHIHIHLAVFVNGHPRQIPAGVGIAPPRQAENTPVGTFVYGGSCFYWLHTHAADGIIHVESPSVHVYTLGNFFDIWRQPLSATQAGPATGTVTAFVNGAKYTGDPASIQLKSHDVIQLDLGKVVAYQPYSFASGL